MNIVTVTLMRKGSKRFPGKNMAPLAGLPLYQYTLMDAHRLGYPYTIFHNYDKLNLVSGVTEIKYPGEGTTMDRVAHIPGDIFIMLPATSPFRDLEEIRHAVQMMLDRPELKIIFSVKKLRDGFYYDGWANNLNFSQKWRNDKVYPEPLEVYRETGSFYIFRRCQLYEDHITKCAAHERHMVPDKFGIDINTEADLKEAEKWLDVM